MEDTLPPGFRFHPTDEELITYYLSNKVSDFDFTTRAVAEVDLNKCEPWDLPAKASMGVKEWYFFNLKDRKYPTGLRTNRATEAGYWKTTGNDKEIFRGNTLVGMKKTLVFYRGRAPKGEKTNWVMHEYRLETKHGFKPIKEEWVVCRVFEKTSTVKKPPQTPSSPPSHDEYYSPCDDTNDMMISEPGDDIDFPSYNNTMQLSNTTNIAQQNYVNSSDHNNMMLNWPNSATEATPLSSLTNWPLLNSNLSMNSLLLTALQLRSVQQSTGVNSSNYNPFFPNGISQFGINEYGSNPNLNLASPSSSRVMDSVPRPPLEQPFDVDSNIW